MSVRVATGDCLEVLASLPDATVHCCVTSPPYFGLRDYGHAGQIGLEPTPDAYVAKLVDVFREVRRVLRDDGTLWLNLGDSYAGGGGYAPDAPCNVARRNGEAWGALNPSKQERRESRKGTGNVAGCKPKDLLGIPWRVAFALQADGWYLRSDIIWHKPNPMPESVTDRPTKAHEYLFLLSKQPKYYYDAAAIAEPLAPASAERYDYDFGGAKSIALVEANKEGIGRRTSVVGERAAPEGRNRRTVWTVTTQPYSGAHFATFPPALIEPCILAGCPEGGTVLDPFGGAGTTGLVADRLQRNALLIELNPEYADMARHRITGDAPLFADVV